MSFFATRPMPRGSLPSNPSTTLFNSVVISILSVFKPTEKSLMSKCIFQPLCYRRCILCCQGELTECFFFSLFSFLELILAMLPSCLNFLTLLYQVPQPTWFGSNTSLLPTKLFRFLSCIPNSVVVVANVAHNSLKKQVLQSRNQSQGNPRGQMATLK